MWFIGVGVEVEQETNAPPPKKNPGSAPDVNAIYREQFHESMWRRLAKHFSF